MFLPVLSAQLMTAPTGRPREIRNLAPAEPPRPVREQKRWRIETRECVEGTLPRVQRKDAFNRLTKSLSRIHSMTPKLVFGRQDRDKKFVDVQS